MIAHIHYDALVLILHQLRDIPPVVSAAKQPVHDDERIAVAVNFMSEFHFKFSVLNPIRPRSF